MKKIIILLSAVIMTAATLSAQTVPSGLKYKQLKNMYNTREYVKMPSNPYSPGWAGIGSFVVPGLGQMICGEVGRGASILAGNVAISVAGNLTARKVLSYVEKDAAGKYVKGSDGQYVVTDEKAFKGWAGALIGLGAVALGYDIWNICDAVKVAKVKNMYFQDLQGHRSMELDLYPSVHVASTANGAQAVAGMTFALQF